MGNSQRDGIALGSLRTMTFLSHLGSVPVSMLDGQTTSIKTGWDVSFGPSCRDGTGGALPLGLRLSVKPLCAAGWQRQVLLPGIRSRTAAGMLPPPRSHRNLVSVAVVGVD
jgi:hypothetical protein